MFEECELSKEEVVSEGSGSTCLDGIDCDGLGCGVSGWDMLACGDH